MPGVALERSDYNAYQYERGIEAINAFMYDELCDVTYDVPEDDEIETRLKRIFRSSFPISNGSPLVQFLLQASAIKVMGLGVEANKISEAFSGFDLNTQEFYPPKRHTKTGGNGIKLDHDRLDFRIGQIWSIFENIACNIGKPEEIEETEEMQPFDWRLLKSSQGLDASISNSYIWSRLCETDLRYLTKGRPGQDDAKPQRQFRSTVKNHILDGKPTGSEEIDIACILVRATIKFTLNPNNEVITRYICNNTTSGYRQVSCAWEQRHDAIGQFAPADFKGINGQPCLEQTEGGNWKIHDS